MPEKKSRNIGRTPLVQTPTLPLKVPDPDGPRHRLPQVDCCLGIFLVFHDPIEGGCILRPLGAAAAQKKSEVAVSVVSTSGGDSWRLPLMATASGKPQGRATHLPGSLGVVGGPGDLWMQNCVISPTPPKQHRASNTRACAPPQPSEWPVGRLWRCPAGRGPYSDEVRRRGELQRRETAAHHGRG